MDCTVVVVNYRTDELLRECLRSLEATTDPATVETIVVDNSATLRRAGFPALFPWARFMESPGNVGFARACNLGLREARGRHFMLLNPDAVVHPGAIRTLVAHLDQRPDVGIAGPRLLNPDGTLQFSCRRFPRWFTILFGRYALLTRLFPRNRGSLLYLYQDWDHADTRAVDWVSGACLMARREAVDRVGPLDEGYFLFVEDMDWCRRMHDIGYRVDYVPTALVTHRIGVSRGPAAPYVVIARHRAMLRYVRKHFRPPWPLRAAVAAGLWVRAGLHIGLGWLAAPPPAADHPLPAEAARAWAEGEGAG